MTTARHLVALGSSFAEGPGIEPVADAQAMRSSNNYAHQLARRLGWQLRDLSVTGATSANVVDTPQQSQIGPGQFPPQLEGLPGNADVVTVTVGGNDLQFSGSMLYAALKHEQPSSPLLELMEPMFPSGIPPASEAVIAEATGGLVAVIDGIRAQAPNARVVLVDYLTVLEADISTPETTPFVAEELSKLLALQTAIERVFADAAAHRDVDLLLASELGRGHSLGSANPWVQPLHTALDKIGGSFHPNQAGMTAIADGLVGLLSG